MTPSRFSGCAHLAVVMVAREREIVTNADGGGVEMETKVFALLLVSKSCRKRTEGSTSLFALKTHGGAPEVKIHPKMGFPVCRRQISVVK